MFAAIDTAARRTCEVRPNCSPRGNAAVRRYASSTSACAACQTLSFSNSAIETSVAHYGGFDNRDHPSSVNRCARSDSIAASHPSSIFHLRSSIFHLPSSIFHLPSSIFHLPSPFLRVRPRLLVHHPPIEQVDRTVRVLFVPRIMRHHADR